MIHAYDEIYLAQARTTFGRMLDFAVFDYQYKLTAYYAMFLSSAYCKRFEDGDINILAGMSGYELTYAVLEEQDPLFKRIDPVFEPNRSKEYWCGWALSYYAWETSLSFSEINSRIPIEDVLALYSPFHEMDIQQFIDKMNELYLSSNSDTNLKRLRQKTGLSQSQLAFYADIPVRTIQQYEQRQKNINKAQAEYLLKLSRVLNCSIEDLFEKITPNKK